MTHQIGVAWLAAAIVLRQQADHPSLDDNLQQACLRRSISTAYYAVFHLITGDSTALVCVDAHESPVAHRLRRSLNHADIKKVLATLLGLVEHDQRNGSGPGPASIAEAVISEWQLLSPDLKQQFAQRLVLRVMPNPR